MTPEDASLPTQFSFSHITSGRAFDGISTQIREAMAAGILTPGVRLPPERTLAAQFGVSRNTLREALRSLESSGVLKLRQGAQAGAYVCRSNGQGVANGLLDMYKLKGVTPSELTEARILLESAIVKAACSNCTLEDIYAMRANLALALKLHKEGKPQERIEKNIDFHRLLARATHNALLVSVMEAILDVVHEYVRTLGSYNASFVFASRRRFLKLLEERDAEGAAAEMEKSLRQLQKLYLPKFGNAIQN